MAEKKKEGVCCECQKVNPLRPSNANPDGEDNPFTRIPDDDEVESWVMDTHEAFGSHCNGSGTMPQAVLND